MRRAGRRRPLALRRVSDRPAPRLRSCPTRRRPPQGKKASGRARGRHDRRPLQATLQEKRWRVKCDRLQLPQQTGHSTDNQLGEATGNRSRARLDRTACEGIQLACLVCRDRHDPRHGCRWLFCRCGAPRPPLCGQCRGALRSDAGGSSRVTRWDHHLGTLSLPSR